MRLTLVISSLAAGGSERVISELANYWANKGHSITLLVFTDDNSKPFYFLEPNIKLVPLNINKVSKNFIDSVIGNYKRLKILRSAIKKSQPEAVISFMVTTNVLVLMSCVKMGAPVVIAERTNPASHVIGKTWELLRSVFYSHASRIVVLSNQGKNFFSKKLQEKVMVIPNAVSLSRLDNQTAKQPMLAKPYIVAMGRLSKEKGFDLLVQAFSQAYISHPEWYLIIVGDGVLRAELQSLCQQLGVQDAVIFMGLLADPFPVLKQAEIFVSPSRYEGFPNALCEAMACGLPVISFNCATGPADIIRHDVDGLLVPPEDVTALATAMSELMSDPARRAAMGKRATEILQRFSPEKIMQQWDALLMELLP
jgi:GalNAc-alpha-(1->4)-GalNAc-alpha-(1->3)-diNAcBac-PP-undecaprenol alpha-1,4-N-acetyl-D-galactosaminyltransferase